MSEAQDAKTVTYSLEVEIAGDVDAVWKALTSDIDRWWPQEFFAGGTPGHRSFSLDATPGGRMVELWDGGGGLLWATVVTVQPPAKLQLTGASFPEWGGPATTMISYVLEEGDGSTVLRFSESTVGKVSDANLAEKDKGWRFLYERALRAHVEGGEPPVWAD